MLNLEIFSVSWFSFLWHFSICTRQTNTFSAGILATHSSLDFLCYSVGVGGRLREAVIGCFFLFILYGSSVRSLSLATLHLLSFEPVTFILHECSPPAHPLTVMFL